MLWEAPLFSIFSFLYSFSIISDKLSTLDDLFVQQLKDLYSAENQLVKALPNMVAEAQDAQLRQGFKKAPV